MAPTVLSQARKKNPKAPRRPIGHPKQENETAVSGAGEGLGKRVGVAISYEAGLKKMAQINKTRKGKKKKGRGRGGEEKKRGFNRRRKNLKGTPVPCTHRAATNKKNCRYKWKCGSRGGDLERKKEETKAKTRGKKDVRVRSRRNSRGTNLVKAFLKNQQLWGRGSPKAVERGKKFKRTKG